MSRVTPPVLWFAAVLVLGLVPSLASAAPSCAFQARGMELLFGVLDPSAAANKTAPATVISLNADRWGSCSNQTMSMTATTGLYASGGVRRMSNGSAFIPYALTLPANATGPAGNGYVQFVISGTVLGSDYIDAPAGSYSDTVLITVSP